ncbi:MAG: S8 family serine peptidase, partial [Elusimicrobiota bacterium]
MSDIGGAPPGTLPFVSGAAPKAKLAPLRVNDSVVHFSYANLCRALYRCVERGYHVVSMSLGGPFGSSTLH